MGSLPGNQKTFSREIKRLLLREKMTFLKNRVRENLKKREDKKGMMGRNGKIEDNFPGKIRLSHMLDHTFPGKLSLILLFFPSCHFCLFVFFKISLKCLCLFPLIFCNDFSRKKSYDFPCKSLSISREKCLLISRVWKWHFLEMSFDFPYLCTFGIISIDLRYKARQERPN